MVIRTETTYIEGIRVYIPLLNALVIPDLNAFLVVLSRLGVQDQIDILDQATTQIRDALSRSV